MGKLTLESGITVVTAVAYKVGGRRYFTRNAAQRALAKSCAKQALERQGLYRGFGRERDGSPRFDWNEADEARYWRAIAYLSRIYRRFGTPILINGNANRRSVRQALSESIIMTDIPQALENLSDLMDQCEKAISTISKAHMGRDIETIDAAQTLYGTALILAKYIRDISAIPKVELDENVLDALEVLHTYARRQFQNEINASHNTEMDRLMRVAADALSAMPKVERGDKAIYFAIQKYIIANWDAPKSQRAYPGYPGPLDFQALQPYLDEANEVLFPTVQKEQEGWKLVPIEPSPEQCQAAFGSYLEGGRNGPISADFLRQEAALSVYRKMLAAAPSPAQEDRG